LAWRSSIKKEVIYRKRYLATQIVLSIVLQVVVPLLDLVIFVSLKMI